MLTCDCCGMKFTAPTQGGAPVYQYYKGMPFKCCNFCLLNEDYVISKVEPKYLKWCEEQNMGNISPTESDLPKSGETWYIYEKPYVIYRLGQFYFETNGDSSTKYISMEDEKGVPYVITEKAFLSKATRQAPIKDVYVTIREILEAEPCGEGVRELAYIFGATPPERRTPLKAQMYLYDKDLVDTSYKVSELYKFYTERNHQYAPTNYLLWLAKLKKLVPSQSSGPEAATLLRLLGIKK